MAASSHGVRYHRPVTSLVQPETPEDPGLAGLRERAAELEAALTARSAEAARVKADLDHFEIKYREQVGLLHEQLDDLEFAISEAEARWADKNGVEPQKEPRRRKAQAARPEALPRFTTDAVRRLFRDVAKAIHPDLAHDEEARDRRHSLMVEANRAYELGDEEHLRSILHAWERSPEAVLGSDPDAIRLRLARRVAQMDEALTMLAQDLADLKSSPIGKLKTLVDEASARGKDLVQDMVKRLKRDILVATNRLDAIRPPD